MATEYISYERFLDEIRLNRKVRNKAKTKVRYKSNEYMFWYEKGKYCFKQYLPEDQNVQRFGSYERMLIEIRIEGESIENLWDKDGFEFIYEVVKNWFIDKRSYSYYYEKYYKRNKELYSHTMMKAQKNNVKKGTQNIIINKQIALNIWDFSFFGSAIIFLCVFGTFALLLLSYIFEDVVFDRTMVNFTFIGLILAHVFTFMAIGFFAPLLTDAPNRMASYYHANRPLYIYALITLGIAGLWNLWLVPIIIVCDAISMGIGHIAYRLYYKKKLQEAEKLREEYRKEQEAKKVRTK